MPTSSVWCGVISGWLAGCCTGRQTYICCCCCCCAGVVPCRTSLQGTAAAATPSWSGNAVWTQVCVRVRLQLLVYMPLAFSPLVGTVAALAPECPLCVANQPSLRVSATLQPLVHKTLLRSVVFHLQPHGMPCLVHRRVQPQAQVSSNACPHV